MKKAEKVLNVIEMAAYATAFITIACAIGVLLRGGCL